MEKRRAHRIRVNIAARYESSAVSLEGQVADLSCDGLFLKSEYVGSRGERVRLDLVLPGTEGPVELEGEVVRTADETASTTGMGIRFYDVALPTRLQLANYMLLQTSRTPG